MKLRTCRGKDQQQDHTRGVWFSVAIRPIALLLGPMGLFFISLSAESFEAKGRYKRGPEWWGMVGGILAESEDSNGDIIGWYRHTGSFLDIWEVVGRSRWFLQVWNHFVGSISSKENRVLA